MVIEGLGAIAALHKLHYFCRGQAVIDLFLDSKTMVEAWCNKGLEEMAPGLQDIMIKLARWPLRLHYCEGKKHIIPDSLGRNCVSGQEEYGPEIDEVEGRAEYPAWSDSHSTPSSCQSWSMTYRMAWRARRATMKGRRR